MGRRLPGNLRLPESSQKAGWSIRMTRDLHKCGPQFPDGMRVRSGSFELPMPLREFVRKSLGPL